MSKVTVITGGAGGMGLATAKIVSQESTVIISDVNEEQLEAAKKELDSIGIQCKAVKCDITDLDAVSALVKTAQAQGEVTSVIHTAGVSPSMGSAEMVLRINAVGTVYINQAFLEIAGPGFAIVNVSSMAGYQMPRVILPKKSYKYAFSDTEKLFRLLLRRSNLTPKKLRSGIAYSISKNFVTWYSQAAASMFGEKDARIVSVSPGSFSTQMGELEKDRGAGAMADISALKRFGTPEEIAEVLAFCASPKAGYLTGTDILCDGGTIAAIKIHGKKPDIKLFG